MSFASYDEHEMKLDQSMSSSADVSMNMDRSRCSLVEKFELPLRSSFCVSTEDTFIIGELEISRHNGMFWNRYKTKSCVLLKYGRLFIYSQIDRGLSVSLCDLREVSHSYSEKKIAGKESEVKARCEFILVKEKTKLRILVKGSRSFVTSWRCGLVTAHHGLPLQSANDTDQFTWAQPEVDVLASEQLMSSLTERSLRFNRSHQSFALDFSNHTLPSSRKYSAIIGQMKKARSLESRFSIPQQHNETACVQTQEVTNTSTICSSARKSDEVVVDVQQTGQAAANQPAVEPDSGVCSPVFEMNEDDFGVSFVAEENTDLGNIADAEVKVREETVAKEEKAPADDSMNDSKKSVRRNPTFAWRSRLEGIPLLDADILDFDAAFAVGVDYIDID